MICFLSEDFLYTVCQMDHYPFKLNLHLCKKAKSSTTARKSILELVKLPSLVAKWCKIRKIYAWEVCKFCIFLYYARRSLTTSGHFVVRLLRNTKIYKNLQTLQAYISRILQHFATKLGDFTNFKMLFLAV